VLWSAVGLLATIVLGVGLWSPWYVLIPMAICGALMMIGSIIWIIVLAFQESVICGLLMLVAPFFGGVFVRFRSDQIKKPLLTFFGGLALLGSPALFPHPTHQSSHQDWHSAAPAAPAAMRQHMPEQQVGF